jgi:hypothetical protein
MKCRRCSHEKPCKTRFKAVFSVLRLCLGATTAMQAVLLYKRASKLSDPLDYDPTTDTTMVC